MTTLFIVVLVIGVTLAIGGAFYDHHKKSNRGIEVLLVYTVLALSYTWFVNV